MSLLLFMRKSEQFPCNTTGEYLDSLSYVDEAWFTLRPPATTPPSVVATPPIFTPPPPTCTITATTAPPPTYSPRTPKRLAVVEAKPLFSPVQPAFIPTAPTAAIKVEESSPKRARLLVSTGSSSSLTSGSKTPVNHTSQFRGVSCCGKDRKFQARIRDGSKVHYLGRFNNDFDAAIKYDEASRSHKGDRSIPNFIEMTFAEKQALRAHYFANGQTIQPSMEHFLFQFNAEANNNSKRRSPSFDEEEGATDSN